MFASSGAASTLSTSQSNATIQYDSGTRGYTITLAGRSQTFLPADLDANQSTSTIAVYLKTHGATTDSLTLTRAGTSGRFTYRYTGTGFWQRTTTGSPLITGSMDAFAYGVATPVSAVPRTGRSEYEVDLIGAATYDGSVRGITGQGVIQVDFATGAILTHGTARMLFYSSIFSSEAALSSTTNSFSGNFRMRNMGYFTGTLEGRFYGPYAEEVGATVSAQSANNILVAAIVGRGSSVTATNATVTNPTVSEFFANDATIMTTTLHNVRSPTNTGTGFSGGATGISPIILNYDHYTNRLSVISSDKSQYFDETIPSQPLWTKEELIYTTPRTDLNGNDYATFMNLKYVASRRWLTTTGFEELHFRAQPFVFGVKSTDSALPRTGFGGYAIGLQATVAGAGFGHLIDIEGFGILRADFASSALTAGGIMKFRGANNRSGLRYVGEGNFSITGTISGDGNRFSGPISVVNQRATLYDSATWSQYGPATIEGFGVYNGTHNGSFYGPNAEEIGAAFSATDGSGGTLVGTFAGGIDPFATRLTSKISELTAATNLEFRDTKFNGADQRPDVVQVNYDPSTSSYSISLKDPIPMALVRTVTLAPSNRNSTASDGGFDVHTGTVDDRNYTASLLKPVANNNVITLSYTSLAEIAVAAAPANPATTPTYRFMVFGIPTSQIAMPLSGVATYNGIARGVGQVTADYYTANQGAITNYTLSGQSSLIADFGRHTVTTTLTLTGTPTGAGPVKNFDPISSLGAVATNGFLFLVPDHISGGGLFFGPGAEEIGGTFSLENRSGDDLVKMNGAFVGKR